MVGKYKVITLCGSTRFKDAFMEVQKQLTLEGNIVISVGLFGHSGDSEVWTEGTKQMLDDMHKRKTFPVFIYNTSTFLPRRTWCEASSLMRGCNPPCLSMRNNAPVEHCVAEAFILREIVLAMKPNFTLRAYHRLTSRVLRDEE